jgi:hypothetical protein
MCLLAGVAVPYLYSCMYMHAQLSMYVHVCLCVDKYPYTHVCMDRTQDVVKTRQQVYNDLDDIVSLYLKEVYPAHTNPCVVYRLLHVWTCCLLLYVCMQGIEPIGLSDRYRSASPQQQIHYGDVSTSVRLLLSRRVMCCDSIRHSTSKYARPYARYRAVRVRVTWMSLCRSRQ